MTTDNQDNAQPVAQQPEKPATVSNELPTIIGDVCQHCGIGHSLGDEKNLCDHCNLPVVAVRKGNSVAVPQSKPPVGSQTNEIANADGVMIAWDIIEEYTKANGVQAASDHFKVSYGAIRSRKVRHKWKKVPDGRLAKRDVTKAAQLIAAGADLSGVIGAHRASVVEKIATVMDKSKPKIKSMRDFQIADDVVRKSLGIDDAKPAQQSVLISINEAIDQHQSPEPIEAEVLPCNPEPLQNESVPQLENATVPQGDTVTVDRNAPKESAAPPPNESLKLNASEAPRRQFVVVGSVKP